MLAVRKDKELVLVPLRLKVTCRSLYLPAITAAHLPPQGTDSQELLLILSLGGTQILPSLERS